MNNFVLKNVKKIQCVPKTLTKTKTKQLQTNANFKNFQRYLDL